MLTVGIIVSITSLVSGHGRLVEPPSRNSAWRYGFGTPPDYSDHALSSWCGGRGPSSEGTRCGTCGNPPGGPKDNEVGGKYFTGKIVRSYQRGQEINIKVEVTAPHHRSWFEFKICPASNNHQEVSQSCLDLHKLKLTNGGSMYQMPFYAGVHNIKARLPNDVSCNRCVLQWTWHSTDTKEMYRACSDISIGGGGGSSGGGGGGSSGGGGARKQRINGGGCRGHDTPCEGNHGTQANCCGGLYCHKSNPGWAQGMCYYG